MSSIPPHYSERYVNQRYNKALQIVQRLPASSAFQPSRKQKLELYAYYKQVSHGDINTQRPGIFDVVGRAKWDAWKKLEGMSKLEAKHRYVDTLLKAATEAYKTPSSRPTAQQIIHAFALIKPSGENDTEDDDFDTEDQASQDEDSSLASADAEEQAYLMEIEADTGRLNSSSHTEISSPEVQRRRIVSPASSTRSRGHKRRSWHDNTTRQHTDRLLPHMIPARERLTASGRSSRNRSYDDENLNPWADRYGSSEENERRTPSRIAMRNALSVTRSPTPRSRALKPRLPHLQSPFYGSSTSSSVTATASNVVGQATNMPPADSRASSRLAEQNVVALGPATKRALESLQAEVVALNERIDDLRRELRTSSVEPHVTVAAPAAAMPGSSGSSSNGDDDAISDSWKWVIRAALKHAAVNLVTILIFLFILYKRGSPVAFAITDQFFKLWRNVKHRMFFHVVV